MPPSSDPRYANTRADSNAAHILALNALIWTLEDEARAARLLALTGLDGDSLRGRLDDPALLGAVIDFLESHEPDLIACAAALDIAPPALLAARAAL